MRDMLVAAEFDVRSGFQFIERTSLFSVQRLDRLYDVTPDDQRFVMAHTCQPVPAGSRFTLVQNFFEELNERMGGN